jgi:antitoxin component YwqK of YwqJK toxin-antitoxin module
MFYVERYVQIFLILSLFSCTDSKEKSKVNVYYLTVQNKYVLPKGIEVNGLKQGIWIEYSAIGFIQSMVTYVDGIEEGETLRYNEHGIIIQKIEVHQGKLSGKFECFSNEGVQTIKGTYFDNKKIGDWFYYDDNGILIEQEKWGNGIILSKKVFKK